MACYLVTGGSGYIGSRLVPRLIQEGHRVLVLYRDAAESPSESGIIPLGLGSVAAYREALRHHAVDGVFHLASVACYAQSENDIAPMIEANITLGTQLLEAMQWTDCHRFVNVATYWQHYDSPEYTPSAYTPQRSKPSWTLSRTMRTGGAVPASRLNSPMFMVIMILVQKFLP